MLFLKKGLRVFLIFYGELKFGDTAFVTIDSYAHLNRFDTYRLKTESVLITAVYSLYLNLFKSIRP